MNAKPLLRTEFADLIPHAGAMSLIDRVDRWSGTDIVCRAGSHRDPANPLNFNGYLSTLHLLEYGAQTAAIHGGLLSGKARPGFFAAARNACFFVDDLAILKTDLLIAAKVQLSIRSGAVYDIVINDLDPRLLFKGRITVIYP